MCCFLNSKCNENLTTGKIKIKHLHILASTGGFRRKLKLLCCSIRLFCVCVPSQTLNIRQHDRFLEIRLFTSSMICLNPFHLSKSDGIDIFQILLVITRQSY